MNRLIKVLKYIALYFGFVYISNLVILRFFTPAELDTYLTVNSTSGVIAVLLTLACFRAEHTKIVKNAPNRKSKIKYFILVLITLGIVVYLYRRRKIRLMNG